MKTVEEELKKSFLNKWLVYSKEKYTHYFFINKVYWLENYIDDTNSVFFALYHAKIVNRTKELIHFSYIKDVNSDFGMWGGCSFVKAHKMPKRLKKELTKMYLGRDVNNGHPGAIYEIFWGKTKNEKYEPCRYFSDTAEDLE